jgi:hypothetical protein
MMLEQSIHCLISETKFAAELTVSLPEQVTVVLRLALEA